MSQLLVILGATGQQGGSLADFVLSDPALSARYKVRGVTRDPTQPAAQALRAKGAEVVAGNLDDPASLDAAFAGAHTVFIATVTVYDDQVKERDVRQGKAAADAAVAAGAKYLIYSTEVHAEVITGGKIPVPAFDSRGVVEAYIRSLPVQSAFYAPASFMQNLATLMAPRPVAEGVYAMANICPAKAVYPWIDVVADTGRFVGAVLAEPDKFAGKTLYAAGGLYSFEEVVEKLSRHTGKVVQYVAMSEEQFRGDLPPAARDPMTNMFRFIAEYGYFGPETARLVRETAALVPYKLTTLDEYIAANVRLA
ncbi:hypothetical protein C8A01DRAFT_43053 [Parachaetomium inaequale]|uniref:NmrA-like domain-containing protein n=1 Tax=Parachaetomium inaequale TaxID=2588326 RepID=A0AAN6PN62_9PEZI|nr:hypothetical protein C8A01DRAFT_43053 [Parachaetomium inaequale]